MEFNPVTWFEIYVDDIHRATNFYQAVFKSKLEPLGDPADESMIMMSFPSEMTKYGAAGALVKMKGISAGGNSTLVYFGCDDCAVEQGRVEAAGGKIFRPKFSIGEYGSIALVCDTEGNMIGLHSNN